MPQQLPMGLPQGFHKAPQGAPLSFYNVYTKGSSGLNNNGLSRVLALVDDELFYKTASDAHAVVTAGLEQLEKVS